MILGKKKWIVLGCFLVVAFLIVPMTVVHILHSTYFGERVVDDNNYYEYFSNQDTGFLKIDSSFHSDEEQILTGGFYYYDETTAPKGLVVWVHGVGVSHENYLPEIQQLSQSGYLVFSYDSTGVNNSQGDSLKGLTQGAIDLQYALAHLDTIVQVADLPCILIGHSWGGFSVATVPALPLDKDVDGIVSLAGFWKNINIISDIGKKFVGNIAAVLVPYLSVYEYVLFQEDSFLDGIYGLSATDAQVLMIHSIDDDIVQYDTNFQIYKEIFSSDPRFRFHTYENAGHKLTVDQESCDRIYDINYAQTEMDKTSGIYAQLSEERLTLIDDLNETVMDDILSFCDEIARNHKP